MITNLHLHDDGRAASVTRDARLARPFADIRWHRPLLWLAAAMVPLAVVCLVGMFVDDRQIVGVGAWEKPLKFALSTALYSVTWSWLIGQLDRRRRMVWWAGTVMAVLLVVELAIIVGAAAAGIQSHFNVSTALSTTLWSVMAASISTIWIAAMVVGIMLLRARLGDPARSLALRAAVLLSLVGMALAFLMTTPTADQLNDFQGIAGAHAVGVADGGPGLPLLGWSTVGGDLRIPHFVGMHALQVIPLFLIALELAARRVPVLRTTRVRTQLVTIAVATYSALLVVLTLQALGGQSIVRPDTTVTAISLTVLAVATVATVVVPASARSSRATVG